MRGYFHNLVLLGLCPVRIVVQDVLLIQKEKIILEMFTGWTIDCEYWTYPVYSPFTCGHGAKTLSFDRYNPRNLDSYNPRNPRKRFQSICQSSENICDSPRVWPPLACVPRPHSELLSAARKDCHNFSEKFEVHKVGEEDKWWNFLGLQRTTQTAVWAVESLQ